jgi:ketosteroid isomerase-like protein
MRVVRISVVALVLATPMLPAQAPSAQAAPVSAVRPRVGPDSIPAAWQSASSTERTLIRLEDDWARALVRRDTATFRRLLAPRFVYTEDATVMSADDVIRSVVGPDHVEWAGNEGMKVYDYGNTAVVTGILAVKGRGKEGSFSRRYRFTDTWLRRDGRWQVIAAQDYVIPK